MPVELFRPYSVLRRLISFCFDHQRSSDHQPSFDNRQMIASRLG